MTAAALRKFPPWMPEPVEYLPLRKPITAAEHQQWALYLLQGRQAMQRAGLRELGVGGLSAEEDQ